MPHDKDGMKHPSAPTGGGFDPIYGRTVDHYDRTQPIGHPHNPGWIARDLDIGHLTARLNVALEDRDHWHAEARREHALVEHAVALLRQYRSEAAGAMQLVGRMQVERDKARAIARQLYAQNLEIARDMLALFPPTYVDASVHEDALRRVTLLQHEAERLLRERNAARAALAEVTATLRPVVDRVTCRRCGHDHHNDPCTSGCPRGCWACDVQGVCANCGGPLQTVRPGKVQCPDCGVCQKCGRTTYRGKCPNGCDLDNGSGVCTRCGAPTLDGACVCGCYPRDYSEEPG